MGDTTLFGDNMEWFQLYEQSFHQGQGSPSNSSTTTTTTTTSPPSSRVVSPSGKLVRSTNTFSKPITKRRYRASKKTPTTHLNANPNNFRAVVQKFTGCPKISPNGPVNLNFKLGKVQSRRGSTNLISLFGVNSNINNNNNNNNQDHHRHHQQQQNSHMVEWPEQSIGLEEAYCKEFTSSDDHDHKAINSVDHENSWNNLPVPSDGGDPNSIINYGSPCNYLEMPDDGFFVDFPLYEFRLLEETFSSEVASDCFA